MIDAIGVGFLAMTCFAVASLLLKKISLEYHLFSIVTIRTLVTGILATCFAFYSGIVIPSGRNLAIILFAGFIGAIAYYSFVKAVKLGDVSIVATLIKTHIVLTIILSILFLGEILTLVQIIAIVIILLGILMLSENFSKIKDLTSKKFSKALPYVITTIVLWGVFYFLLKILNTDLGPINTTAYIELAVFIFYLPLAKDLKKPQGKNLIQIVLLGFIVFLAALFYNYGMSLGYVSIVAPIVSAELALIILGGVLFFNEKLTRMKIIALLVMITGLILISL